MLPARDIQSHDTRLVNNVNDEDHKLPTREEADGGW